MLFVVLPPQSEQMKWMISVEVFVIMVLDGVLFSSVTSIFFSLPFLLFNPSQVSTSTNFIKVAAKKAEWNACLAKWLGVFMTRSGSWGAYLVGELRSAGFPGKCEKLEKDLRGASKAKPDPISPSLPEKLGTLGTFRWVAILVFFMWPHKVPVLSSSAMLGSRPCLESGGFDHSPKNWNPVLLVLGRRHWMLRWRDHCWDLNNFQMVVGGESNKFYNSVMNSCDCGVEILWYIFFSPAYNAIHDAKYDFWVPKALMKCTSSGSRSKGCASQFLAMREYLGNQELQKPKFRTGDPYGSTLNTSGATVLLEGSCSLKVEVPLPILE